MPDVKSAEKLLYEHEMETTTSFVMCNSYDADKGKSNARGPPYMNSAYGRECQVEGCRRVRETNRGRGIQKCPIMPFHKNYK